MNDHQVNGAEAPPVAPAPIPVLTKEQQLEAWIGQVLSCTVRGAMASLHGVRPETVLLVMCRVLGIIMGQIYTGDPLVVARFRKECRDAFGDAIKAQPNAPPVVSATTPFKDQPVQTDTAIPKGTA